MLIGLCGLPNSGKSTFFKLLSRIETEIANYPFTTLKPKEAVVPILSKELEYLHNITQTKEIVPGFLKFLDVPGLIRGAHKGEGLGNEFLSYLRQCDVILEVVRTFKNENVPHPENTINPERDILIIEEEIIESEKNIIKHNLIKLNRATTKEEKIKKESLENILNKIESLNCAEKSGHSFFDTRNNFENFSEYLKEYNLLLTKNWFLIFNGESPDIKLLNNIFKNIYSLDFKWELDLEETIELQNDFVIEAHNFLEQFRKDLNLIQFFTFTQDITQSWFIQKGSNVFDCAGLIHTDFQKKFRSAEIINLTDLINVGDFKKAKEHGLVKTGGKDTIIKENNIIKILV
ncbi:MAG: DUF933 domain-containing protein [Patescibacteria group bacterium]